MTLSDNFLCAADRLSSKGWTQGTLNDRVTGQMCMLGALGVRPGKEGRLPHMDEIRALADYLRSTCGRCVKWEKVNRDIYEGETSYMLVYSHNDRHLQSGEEAILDLKRASEYYENVR